MQLLSLHVYKHSYIVVYYLLGVLALEDACLSLSLRLGKRDQGLLVSYVVGAVALQWVVFKVIFRSRLATAQIEKRIRYVLLCVITMTSSFSTLWLRFWLVIIVIRSDFWFANLLVFRWQLCWCVLRAWFYDYILFSINCHSSRYSHLIIF